MTNIDGVVIVIPSYEPDVALLELCEELKKNDIVNVVVVDDGSGNRYRQIFDKVENMYEYRVLRHAVNLGKGNALKYAFNEVLNQYENLIGVVTADADGQHSVKDIIACGKALMEHPNELILGCRKFDDNDIPWKSKFGNNLTRFSFRYLCGLNVSDTQSGLRGIPAEFVRTILKTPGERYDYETNMLLDSKGEVEILEIPIDTIYDSKDDYQTHFDPINDSLMIYKTIISYSLASVLTTIIDFAIFSVATGMGVSIGMGTALARLVAAIVNFSLNRNVVFKAKGNAIVQLLRYALLVVFSGFISATLITAISSIAPINIIAIKAVTETALFFFNYFIQRGFIFTVKHKRAYGNQVDRPTDWTKYYQTKRSWFSTYTQQFTLKYILEAIKDFNVDDRGIRILELGGGNSCFAKAICQNADVDTYDIVDNNQLAADLFEKQELNAEEHHSFSVNLLDASETHIGKYDFVFSIGLIEHFRGTDIETIIKRHFEYCGDGG